MSDIYEDINHLYTKIGFTEKYGSELWITIIILLIFHSIFSFRIEINLFKKL